MDTAVTIIDNVLFNNRMKSFYWRTLMMAIALVAASLTQSLTDAHVTGEVAVIAGLVLGEISKAINTRLSQ